MFCFLLVVSQSPSISFRPRRSLWSRSLRGTSGGERGRAALLADHADGGARERYDHLHTAYASGDCMVGFVLICMAGGGKKVVGRCWKKMDVGYLGYVGLDQLMFVVSSMLLESVGNRPRSWLESRFMIFFAGEWGPKFTANILFC